MVEKTNTLSVEMVLQAFMWKWNHIEMFQYQKKTAMFKWQYIIVWFITLTLSITTKISC